MASKQRRAPHAHHDARLPGKGSHEHREIQEAVRAKLQSKTTVVIVEAYIAGKSIDVLVQDIPTKRTRAIEIHLNRRFSLLVDQIIRNFAVGAHEQLILLPRKYLRAGVSFVQERLCRAQLDNLRFCSISDFVPEIREEEHQ